MKWNSYSSSLVKWNRIVCDSNYRQKKFKSLEVIFYSIEGQISHSINYALNDYFKISQNEAIINYSTNNYYINQIILLL